MNLCLLAVNLPLGPFRARGLTYLNEVLWESEPPWKNLLGIGPRVLGYKASRKEHYHVNPTHKVVTISLIYLYCITRVILKINKYNTVTIALSYYNIFGPRGCGWAAEVRFRFFGGSAGTNTPCRRESR